ncbi:hypothetical protein D3C85_1675460 [compost metagenome]
MTQPAHLTVRNPLLQLRYIAEENLKFHPGSLFQRIRISVLIREETFLNLNSQQRAITRTILMLHEVGFQ